MLDFTNPWHFVSEVEKWVRFINELQQMAQLPISDLEDMANSRTRPTTQSRPTTSSSGSPSSTKTAN